MVVKVVKLIEEAKLPIYSTNASAGADLFNPSEDIKIEPGKTVFIKTGLSMEVTEGYAIFLYARSGLASKFGIAPANKVGVVDPDYRGDITVALYNHSSESYTIKKGEKIAQMVIAPYIKASFDVVEKLDNTERGNGGFGSTGK